MRRLAQLAVIGACLAWTSSGQSLTTVDISVIRPDGSMPSGTVTLSWSNFLNAAHQQVAAGRLVVTVTNGSGTVNLTPTDTAVPVGSCYTAAYSFPGGGGTGNYTRTWNVPTSATPVALSVVESNTRCTPQQAAAIAPAQITNGGAATGQCLVWGGFYWAPGNCGSTGPLFTPKSIPFAGNTGALTQNNPNFVWDNTNLRIGIGTNAPGFPIHVVTTSGSSATLDLDAHGGSDQSSVTYAIAGSTKWQTGSQPNGDFFMYDSVRAHDFMEVNHADGVTIIQPASGSTLFGDINYSGSAYKIDVQQSGSTGTMRLFDQTPTTGQTSLILRAGASQGGLGLTSWLDNSGNTVATQDTLGFSSYLSNVQKIELAQNFLFFSSDSNINWKNNVAVGSGTVDLGASRNAAGVLEINNGTVGTYRDLILRNLTINGTAGSPGCLQVDSTGLVSSTASACGGGGGGSVTHTSGPLTAGAVIIGNSGGDVKALASLGTTTQVLHGNATGNPSYSGVSLTADVTGTLPTTSGGTGLNSNFANHLFFGNNSGSGAAPTATQPTFADLAAGTVGAVATFPGGDLLCGGVNPQTGTTYTIAASDECSLTTYNNGSAVAVTLPQASTSGFGARAYFYEFNLGAGAVTITPTVSTINGGASIPLNQGQGALIMSDGTNYSAWVSAAPSGSGTVTSIATSAPLGGGTITTTGTLTCATCVTSASALTANRLVLGGGGQATTVLGSLGTVNTVYHGNSGGAGGFSAVDLGADVTGLLPNAQLGDLSYTKTSGTVATIGPACSSINPCNIRIGQVTTQITAAVTGTLSGTSATDTAYIYWDTTNTPSLTFGINGAETLTCSGCTTATGITTFPAGTIPLWTVAITSNVWASSGTDYRATYSRNLVTPGSGITITNNPSTGADAIATDSTVVPRYFTGSGAPSSSCTQGRDFYTDTSGLNLYFCDATNTWKQGNSGSAPATTGAKMWFPMLGGEPYLNGNDAGNQAYTASTAYYLQLFTAVPLTVSSVVPNVSGAGAAGKHGVIAFMNSSCTKISGSDANFAIDSGGYPIVNITQITIPAGIFYYAWAVEDSTATLYAEAGGGGNNQTLQWYGNGAGFSGSLNFTGSNAPTGSGGTFAIPSSCGTKSNQASFNAPISLVVQ